MRNNFLALRTLKYIWKHPNSKNQKLKALCSFFVWQIRKRIHFKLETFEFIPGVKLHCYPDSTCISYIKYCELYDYNEMNFMLRYLRDGDSFFDIGANIGVYTLLAASKIKNGSIYSFEALPKNYARLEENIKINHFTQVKAYEIAVSNFTGKTSLNLMEGDAMPFIASSSTKNTIEVPTDTIDNLLKNQSLTQLTLAKIDIEGAELLALEGASSLLKQQLPYVWILEINDTVKHFGHEKDDVVTLLQDYGYNLYRYDAGTNELYAISLDQQEEINVLAIAESSIDFVRDRLFS